MDNVTAVMYKRDSRASEIGETHILWWRLNIAVLFSHTCLTFFDISELVQDREGWGLLRRGIKKLAVGGKVQATFWTGLHHCTSTLNILSLSNKSIHLSPSRLFILPIRLMSSFPSEWWWPWCSCWIRTHSISPRYRNRPQRYSREHIDIHAIYLCTVENVTVFQALFWLLDRPAITLSEADLFVSVKYDPSVWLMCCYFSNLLSDE